jgi:hypothetical protein
MAYLYAFAGQASKTQALVRRLLDTMYGTGPDGLSGNEDCGQMSAWFVLSALGFYPVTPASTTYVLGTPLFPRATITLEHGSPLVISAPAVSPSSWYVTGVTLDGVPSLRAWIDHAQLAGGGELLFDVGPEPNRQFGLAVADRPRQAIDEFPIVPAPFVTSGEPLFRGTTRLSFGHVDPSASMHVTLDGTNPGPGTPRALAPLEVTRTTTARAVAVDAAGAASPIVDVSLHRIPDALRLTLSTAYEARYHGGGPLALVDGRRGGPNFRLGRWQGYLGRDLEAIVDFGASRDIDRVSVGVLQDTKSWILMPRDVTFAVSDDGVTYRDLGTAAPDVDPRAESAIIREPGLDVVRHRARFLRVRVRHAGPLPEWHAGAGEPSWLFIDEIVVRP